MLAPYIEQDVLVNRSTTHTRTVYMPKCENLVLRCMAKSDHPTIYRARYVVKLICLHAHSCHHRLLL